MLTTNTNNFPNGDINKFKKLIIEIHMELTMTIHLNKKFQHKKPIDYIIVMDEESGSNEYFNNKYVSSLNKPTSVSDYLVCSISFCYLFKWLVGHIKAQFDMATSGFPLSIQNSYYANIANGNPNGNNSIEHED